MSNEGNNIVYGVSATLAFLTAGAVDAHERGMAALREARQAEADARYYDAVDQLELDYKVLSDLTRKLSKELAEEKAKNKSLTAALAQRQALIDQMRNRA
ncbi:hypothetical protein [Pseudochrobactrum asaccharolyticum]|uniref:hypothetical protein n=1 Tax=Pseudochrobactrum asaccharolyticum TaxID=354351 RepID=UPI004041CC50